ELESGLRPRGRGRGIEVGDFAIPGVEAVGVGRLETFDDSPGTRIHDALVEPERREIAVLVERLDGAALLLVTEDPIDLGGKSVANLLGNRPVGGVEGGQGIMRVAPPGGD